VRFFNKWPEFDYHREAEVIKEFRRLCREKQWRPEERQIVKSDLRDAMVQRFNEIYGTNEKDLEAWQRLCRDTHVKSIPDTLAECEEVRNPKCIRSSIHSDAIFYRTLTKRSSTLSIWSTRERLNDSTPLRTWWNIQKKPKSTFQGRVPMRVDFSGSCSGRLRMNISERSTAVVLVVVVVVVVVEAKAVEEGEIGIGEGARFDRSNEWFENHVDI